MDEWNTEPWNRTEQLGHATTLLHYLPSPNSLVKQVSNMLHSLIQDLFGKNDDSYKILHTLRAYPEPCITGQLNLIFNNWTVRKRHSRTKVETKMPFFRRSLKDSKFSLRFKTASSPVPIKSFFIYF